MFERPFDILPQAVAVEVFNLYMATRHLTGLDNPLNLSWLIAGWINDWKYHPDDVADACRKMRSPTRMAGFHYGSDVTSALAACVNDLKLRRRAREEAANR